MLLLTPQRYDFSSKSQRQGLHPLKSKCYCWHHKGTIFQANHNPLQHLMLMYKLLLTPQRYDFSSKSQQHKQHHYEESGYCWHHKGTIFQANHNNVCRNIVEGAVIVDTTKVRFFKQITTVALIIRLDKLLLLTPQRYDFSSKSQHYSLLTRLNFSYYSLADTTIKLSVFKQIWMILSTPKMVFLN